MTGCMLVYMELNFKNSQKYYCQSGLEWANKITDSQMDQLSLLVEYDYPTITLEKNKLINPWLCFRSWRFLTTIVSMRRNEQDNGKKL